MSQKDIKILLGHILESINILQEHMVGLSKEQFFNNTLVQDGVEKRLENIGEAVSNLSVEFTEKYPQIEWRKISGVRNVLIHEYFGIDLSLIWVIAEQDIPPLKKFIEKVLTEIA